MSGAPGAVHAAVRTEPDLHFGLYPASVAALGGDPDGRQRVKVRLDWLTTSAGTSPEAWATIVTPYADADQGFQMLPEVGSTVVVGFLAGHLDHPYLVGSVWNGDAAAPEPFDDANDKRLIRSRAGSLVELDDTPGAVSVRISTPSGHELLLDDGGRRVRLTAADGTLIELTPAGGVTVRANSTVDVSAAMVTVNAPVSQFNGMVKCETLIATTSVISPAYTPGAGNVW